MSQENVNTVTAAFEAFNTGGIEAVMAFLPPDVVVYPLPDGLRILFTAATAAFATGQLD